MLKFLRTLFQVVFFSFQIHINDILTIDTSMKFDRMEISFKIFLSRNFSQRYRVQDISLSASIPGEPEHYRRILKMASVMRQSCICPLNWRFVPESYTIYYYSNYGSLDSITLAVQYLIASINTSVDNLCVTAISSKTDTLIRLSIYSLAPHIEAMYANLIKLPSNHELNLNNFCDRRILLYSSQFNRAT